MSNDSIMHYEDQTVWEAIPGFLKRGVCIRSSGSEWSVQISPFRVEPGESQMERRFFSDESALLYAEYLAKFNET